MTKKVRITILAALSAVLLLCGLTAFASSSENKAVSDSVTGTFKSINPEGSDVTLATDQGDQTLPLAKSVWVYRNEQKAQLADLRAGDRVEAIMNSKGQAAYIKASSEGTVDTEAQDAATDSSVQSEPTPSPEPAPSAPVPKPTAPAAVPNSDEQERSDSKGSESAPADKSKSGSPEAGKSVSPQVEYSDLNELELKVEGKQFKLQIKQNQGKSGVQYELNLKPEGSGTVHLKGNEAAVWIRELLAPVDLKSSKAKQQILEEIAEHYGIDADDLHVQLDVKWEQQDIQEDKGQKAKNDRKGEPPGREEKQSKHNGKNQDD